MTEIIKDSDELAQFAKFLDTYTYTTEEGSVKLIPFATNGGETIEFRSWVFKNGMVGPAMGESVDTAMDMICVPEATQREIREIEGMLDDEFQALPGAKKEQLVEVIEAREIEAELEAVPELEGE